MRELTVRLRFTQPSLGGVRKRYRENGRVFQYFVFARNPTTGKVLFLQTWWLATLRRAAEVLGRHYSAVEEIRFHADIDGQPRPVPEQLYRRYTGQSTYKKHEQFAAGDLVSVTCLVPSAISDDDFLQLMQYAGKYFGMSPARPNEFGFYTVESVRPTVAKRAASEGPEEKQGEAVGCERPTAS